MCNYLFPNILTDYIIKLASYGLREREIIRTLGFLGCSNGSVSYWEVEVDILLLVGSLTFLLPHDFQTQPDH